MYKLQHSHWKDGKTTAERKSGQAHTANEEADLE